ncbi:MAG: bifunctional acetate--CoA ligase family protein/GNAT family N-acetyltransferase [Rhodocyclaceae bacterium]
MTVRNLEYLFHPRSVAVVGASDAPGGYGTLVLNNLAAGGFSGLIQPVAVRHRSLLGLIHHTQVDKLAAAPDLAVLCSPLESLPDVVHQLARQGTRAAIVTCPIASHIRTEEGESLRIALLKAARPHLMRILGPGSAGIVVPAIGLNASFSQARLAPGRLAFVAQSAAVTAAVVDWAQTKGIGFSCVMHLGDSGDVDIGDVLDQLASDPATEAILLHFDQVTDGHKFMSAARAAGRNKPVVAIRPSRLGASQPVGATRAGALVDEEDVYAAALRRAGIVRVDTTEGLFEAVEALARAKPVKRSRLTIVTNGAGFGAMAAQVLHRGGGSLASFSPETLAALEAAGLSRTPGNPLELPIDSPAHRYRDVLAALLASPDNDSVLLIVAPTAIVPAAEIARAVCEAPAQSARPLLITCWMGGESAHAAQAIANQCHIPSFPSPERAVEMFLGIVQYGINRDLLAETPPSVPTDFHPDSSRGHELVAKALADGREWLVEGDAKALLQAYRLTVDQPQVAHTEAEVVRLAEEQGFPVGLRPVLAADHGGAPSLGTVHGLASSGEVRQAARNLRRRARERAQGIRLEGFSLQPAALAPGSFELLVGAVSDPVFGPLIVFGRGGPSAALVRDVAVALPPLNLLLARDLVERAGVSRLMAGAATIDLDAVCLALVQVSQLVADLDEVAELEIDPLLADSDGVRVMDARIRILPRRRRRGVRRFAIRPYPKELEERLSWNGLDLLLRPIRPEDEPEHGAFLESLSAEDSRYRFFSTMRHLPHRQLARFTQIDYDREMAFVAIAPGADGKPETVGEVRAVADPDNVCAEFAIVVRSTMKGKGLGKLLLQRMIAYLRDRGTHELRGETLPDNGRMKELAEELGFQVSSHLEDGVVELRLPLR